MPPNPPPVNEWDTDKPTPNPMRASLVERAKKRQVVEGKGSGQWIVVGDPKLSDNYDSYLVVETDPGTYSCDCTTHQYGDVRRRRVCSHVTAVILHRRGELPTQQPRLSTFSASTVEAQAADGDGGRVEIAPLFSTPPPKRRRYTTASATVDAEGEANPKSAIPIAEHSQPIPASPSAPSSLPSVPSSLPLDPTSPPLPAALGIALDPPMPERFEEFHHNQWEAVLQVVEAFESGYRVVFLDAPTGSGKTLIAESVRRLMKVRALYTCTTKTLQDQVMRDFGAYAKVIKGRRNYPTLDHPNNPNLTADDCVKRRTSLPACERCPGGSPLLEWRTHPSQPSLGEVDEGPRGWHCSHCHPYRSCPYAVAKDEAAGARLAVLNTAYYLAEGNYVATTPFTGWSLIILDEADRLEEELMGFVEVSIGPRVRKTLGIGLPAKKTVDEAWVEWLVEEVIPAIRRAIDNLRQTAKTEVEYVKRKKSLRRLLDQVSWLTEEPVLPDDELEETFAPVEADRIESELPVLRSGWVYTGYEKKEDSEASVDFKPVRVHNLAPEMLWSHGERFLLMSASFISHEDTAADLGLEEGDWAVVSMPSTFPAHRRPIFPLCRTVVTNKTKDKAYPELTHDIVEILNTHPGKRVLIHTVSYDLTRHLYHELRHSDHRHRVETYFAPHEREGALNRYLAKEDGVMLAPSFDRGVDLSHDDCRVIIIPKVPYGNLGDKQISTRLYSTGKAGRIWYVRQTIRTLVQMTGRGMRSADDECITYILDSEFLRLWRENRRLFPSWWAEALVWDANDPHWRDIDNIETVAMHHLAS